MDVLAVQLLKDLLALNCTFDLKSEVIFSDILSDVRKSLSFLYDFFPFFFSFFKSMLKYLVGYHKVNIF